MIATIPEVTTRPLFHIAKFHGADYTDVLNMSWGIKQYLNGIKPGHWCEKSKKRIYNKEAFEAPRPGCGAALVNDIFEHTANFDARQGLNVTVIQPNVQPKSPPGFEPGGNIWDI